MTTKKPVTEFDFDQWVRLAQEDPDHFEQMRLQKIREMIEDAPEELRHRIEGLQWQIDQMRQTARNPMASCIKISSMMWDLVLGEEGLVQTIENLGKTPKSEQQKQLKQAKIIEFGKSPEPGESS